MKLVHVPMVDEERIAAYIDGNLSQEEMNAFNSDLAHDDALAAFVSDVKADLNMVDNNVTLEQYEPHLDSMNAVDCLFAESNIFPTIDSALNPSDVESMNPLGLYLGLEIENMQDVSMEDLQGENTISRNEDVGSIPDFSGNDDDLLNASDTPDVY